MLEATYRVRKRNKVGQYLLSRFGRLVYSLFARPVVEGIENVPPVGPYIIVFNHLSIFEPPFVLTHWPSLTVPLGAAEVWKEKDKTLLAHMWGGIPIDRDNYHREPLNQVVAALRAGYPVVMAPEGRISRVPGLRRGKLGLALVLEQFNVPVVPVGVVGSTSDFLIQAIKFKRPEIKMVIGKPFSIVFPQIVAGNRKQAYQRVVDEVMAHIALILPEAYRGEYANYQTFLSEAA